MNAPLSPDEVAARLDSIQSGPWMERAAMAISKLSAPVIKFKDRMGSGHLDLDTLAIVANDPTLVKELESTFKWHGEGQIPTHAQREVRDSFDNALTHLQMIELAIETGYLPADQIAHVIRPQFLSLLWPKPAQKFVRIYDYTSVENLAIRLDILALGFRQLKPPPVDASGAVSFASFLATHRAIESNPAIDTWLAFLDDYVIRRGEQNNFYDFLESGALADSKRRLQLLLGAREFAVMLADFLSTLPEHMQARFGSFYAYWLAKLFGYELTDGRYARSAEWGKGEASWASALITWYRLRAENEEEAALMERSLDVLATAWEHVRGSQPVLDSAADLQKDAEALTQREREVLTHMLKQSSYKSTAEKLKLSERMLNIHRARILEKMGALSIAQLRTKLKKNSD